MHEHFHRGSDFPFDFNSISRVPHVKGAVYFFWSIDLNDFIYIGETERTLSERLREHWRKSENQMLRTWIKYDRDDLIVCYLTCPSDLVKKLERRLIRQFDPNANKNLKF